MSDKDLLEFRFKEIDKKFEGLEKRFEKLENKLDAFIVENSKNRTLIITSIISGTAIIISAVV
jgi:chaperonin cofactor prefoldin